MIDKKPLPQADLAVVACFPGNAPARQQKTAAEAVAPIKRVIASLQGCDDLKTFRTAAALEEYARRLCKRAAAAA